MPRPSLTLLRRLPRSHVVPEQEFESRHRILQVILLGHVLGLVAFAAIKAGGPPAALGYVIALLALLAATAVHRLPARARSSLMAVALCTTSAMLVRISDGTPEMHFHFFFVIALLALYEDWAPFVVAFCYLLIHHGLLATVSPESVFGAGRATSHPLEWAAVHGVFLLAVAAAHVGAWKINERTSARAERAELGARLFLEMAGSMILAIDPAGKILLANRRLCDTIGYREDELKGRDAFSVLDLGDVARAKFHERIAASWPDGIVDAELDIRARDASTVTVDAHGRALSHDGELVGVVWSGDDITAQRRRAALERAQHAISRHLAGAGRVDEAAPAVLREIVTRLGWDRASLWQADRDTPICCWPATAQPLSPFPCAHVDWATSFRSTCVRVPLATVGPSTALVVWADDVRDREDEMVHALGQVAAMLGQRLDRERAEQEAERIKREFFALVSHELRTPLTSLLGYLEILRDEPSLSADTLEFLGVMDRSGRRLLRLIGDLLLAAQIDAGRPFLSPAGLVDLGELVEGSIRSAQPLADEAGVSLTFSSSDALVRGDADRLAQAVDNLLSNAIKFTPTGGHVTVDVADEDGRSLVRVTDSGIGLTDEEIEHVFDRFYRSPRAQSAAIAGAGLGLPISQAIAHAHGGDLRAEQAASGEGACFTLTLPGA